jgi:hypothetical protein
MPENTAEREGRHAKKRVQALSSTMHRILFTLFSFSEEVGYE